MKVESAPERIWVDDERPVGGVVHVWSDLQPHARRYATEYIRADLHEALRAENARYREALIEIAKPKVGPEFDWSEDEANRWRAGWYRKYENIARAAMNEKTPTP